MLVKDAMTRDPIVCTAETSLRDAVGLMRKHHIGGLPVMEGTGLVGMLTESDLISLLESEKISDDLWLPSPFEIIEIPIREFINWEKTKHALRNILICAQGKNVVHIFQRFPKIEIHDFKIKFSSLDLGKVQYVVDN